MYSTFLLIISWIPTEKGAQIFIHFHFLKSVKLIFSKHWFKTMRIETCLEAPNNFRTFPLQWVFSNEILVSPSPLTLVLRSSWSTKIFQLFFLPHIHKKNNENDSWPLLKVLYQCNCKQQCYSYLFH